MKNPLLTALVFLLPIMAYACSSDEDGDSAEAGGTSGQLGGSAGRVDHFGGSTRGGSSTGGSAVGGATSRMSGGQTSVGGNTSASAGVAATLGGQGNGGATAAAGVGATVTSGGKGGNGTAGSAGSSGKGSNGGNAGVAGRSATAGNASFAAAGSTIASGGSAGTHAAAGAAAWTATGGSNAAGANAAGSGSSAGHSNATTGGTAGAAGAASDSCGALCAAGCAQPPQCLAAAFNLAEGDSIPICVPPTTQTGVTFCNSTTCNGVAGCALQAQLGVTDWTLTAGTASRTTDVAWSTTIVSISGTITVTSPNCAMNVVVPSVGLPIGATGTAAPASTGAPLLALGFDNIDAPLTGLSLTSGNAFCATLANQALAVAKTTLQQALLDAVNARAAQLACLECRGDCPQQLACTEP